MILEKETFKEFGYYSKDLKPQSHKLVINKCDECGGIRKSIFRIAYPHCKSCGKHGERSANYGKSMTNEQKLKISKTKKERFQSGEIIHWATGLTKETDERIANAAIKNSISHKGMKVWNKGLTAKEDSRILSAERNLMYGKHCSEETKKKISDKNKGRKLNHRIDCGCCACKSKRGELSGKNHPEYGKIWTEEARRKLSMTLRNMEYDENNWNGFANTESMKIRKSKKIIIWRKSVYERDNYTCQLCKHKHGRNLNAHHIKVFKDYPEERLDVDNGITLCEECHYIIHYIGKHYNFDNKYIKMKRCDMNLTTIA